MPTVSSTASAQSPSLWTPFSFPVFRALWLASLVSNLGTWMQNVAGVWLVTTLTTSTLLVALMQTATSLPIFLFGMPAGALADLVDRRRLLLIAQGAMAGVAFLLGGFALAGVLPAEGVLLFTFLLGIGSAFNGPVWQSIAPELIPRAVLPYAVTLNGVNINVARAVGPALGGLVIARFAPGYVFLLNGLSFLGTWLVIYQWRRPRVLEKLPHESFFDALRAGVRYVRYSPAVYAILIRAFAFTFGASALWALLSLVIARNLHLSSGTYGVMLSWLGAGAVTGALVLGRAAQRLSVNKRVLIAIGLFSGVNGALALVRSVVWLYPVMYLSGVAWILIMTSFNVSVQLNLPRWVQARALSIYLLVFQGGMALGSVVWGTVANYYGVSAALLGAAVWLALSMLLAIPFPIRSAEGLDLSPARDPRRPAVHPPVDPDEGPVVVSVEYRIAVPAPPEFRPALDALVRLRLRDGALRAEVFSDIADPTRVVELFVVPSWAEHLRQHERLTIADQVTTARVRAYHVGPEPPRVTHLVAYPKQRREGTPPLFEQLQG
jgi:MFS family permease